MSLIYVKETARQLVANNKGLLVIPEPIKTQSNFSSLERRIFQSLYKHEDGDTSSRVKGLRKYISGFVFPKSFKSTSLKFQRKQIRKVRQTGIIPGFESHLNFRKDSSRDIYKTNAYASDFDEDLRRCKLLGYRFARLSSQFTIGNEGKLKDTVFKKLQVLALLVGYCQAASITPVVSIKTLVDGNITRQYSFAKQELFSQFISELNKNKITLGAMLLSTNIDCALINRKDIDREVAAKTSRETLLQTIPPAIPGIFYDDFNLEAKDVTKIINTINCYGHHPWKISFLISNAFNGKINTPVSFHKNIYLRSRLNSVAAKGRYRDSHELRLLKTDDTGTA